MSLLPRVVVRNLPEALKIALEKVLIPLPLVFGMRTGVPNDAEVPLLIVPATMYESYGLEPFVNVIAIDPALNGSHDTL